MKNKIDQVLREKLLSKRWLAKQLDVDVKTIHNWCKGQGVNEFKLMAVARVLNVEPKDLKDE